jgi:hypothetical protein
MRTLMISAVTIVGFALFGPTPSAHGGSGAQTAAVQPAQTRPNGGLQIDVLPRRAAVFVDGVAAGRVEEFSGYYRHLTLPAGDHLVEILESGYRPVAFEILIVPGRTITYRATLEASSD